MSESFEEVSEPVLGDITLSKFAKDSLVEVVTADVGDIVEAGERGECGW